jgi:hypothetical protein
MEAASIRDVDVEGERSALDQLLSYSTPAR